MQNTKYINNIKEKYYKHDTTKIQKQLHENINITSVKILQ